MCVCVPACVCMCAFLFPLLHAVLLVFCCCCFWLLVFLLVFLFCFFFGGGFVWGFLFVFLGAWGGGGGDPTKQAVIDGQMFQILYQGTYKTAANMHCLGDRVREKE